MLAAIALTLCTVVLFKMKRERFALVTIAPATWLVACTTTAGLEKVFSPDPNVGFISHALKYGEAIAAGQLLAPAKSAAEMTRVVVNDYIDATLAAVFRAGRCCDRDLCPDQHMEGAGQPAGNRGGNRACRRGRGRRPCLTCKTCSIAQ
jgi:carbon starvation protein CstA